IVLDLIFPLSFCFYLSTKHLLKNRLELYLYRYNSGPLSIYIYSMNVLKFFELVLAYFKKWDSIPSINQIQLI
ncbi:MAG TPA: hypothetical protein VFE57_01625, partial [Cyclobacteriaceae bacterium]|nr:hypothetical protein [Cyclobacteriaceae bacterium]